MRQFMFSTYAKESNRLQSPVHKTKIWKSKQRGQKSNYEFSFSPAHQGKQDLQMAELPINLIMVGDALPKQQCAQNKYRTIQQILKQNFMADNLCKKLKMGETRIRLKLLQIVSIEEIIYGKYQETIKQWQTIREPKLFIFMYHESNLDDLEQIYKFIKDVEHLHSRKTLNADEMRRINERRQKAKCNPNQNTKKQELGNWVTGLMICDNFTTNVTPQDPKCKEQALEISSKYNLLHFSTNPSVLSRSKCANIYFWTTILKFYEVGLPEKVSFSMHRMKQFLANAHSYKKQQDSQKKGLKIKLLEIADLIEVIDQKILSIYMQIQQLLDFVSAMEEGIYQYIHHYCQNYQFLTTNPPDTKNEPELQLSRKIQQILHKKIKISENVQILNLIKQKCNSEPPLASPGIISNIKIQPSSKLPQLNSIYDIYSSMLSQQTLKIYQSHDQMIKLSRISIKTKLRQSLNQQTFQAIWEESSIIDCSLYEQNEEDKFFYNGHRVQLRGYSKINQQIRKTKQLFYLIFYNKLQSIKGKIKTEISIIRAGLCEKMSRQSMGSQTNIQVQKRRNIIEKINGQIDCVEKLYVQTLEEIEFKLGWRFNNDLMLFDQVISVNEKNQHVLRRIMEICQSSGNKAEEKKNLKSEGLQTKNKSDILNEYLICFYLQKINAELVAESKQKVKLMNGDQVKTEQFRNKQSQNQLLELRNELCQKLRKCTVKKIQYISMIEGILLQYEKIETLENILKTLNKNIDTRKFELDYIKLNNKGDKKFNSFQQSEAQVLTQHDYY